jgi:hypothetical protein
MSSHSRVRRPEHSAAEPSSALTRPVPCPDAPPPGAAHAGHDFRRIPIFPKAAPIQRQGGGDTEGIADVPEAGGGGEPIPDGVRAAMERSFAQDFSDVRVHTGPEARQVGALAYTRGNDLHFQPGRFDPFGDTGRSLLGHELTHVVQQRAGRVASPTQNKAEGAAPINADSSLEAEADAQGARAARGERAHVSGAGAGMQRKAEGAPIQREEEDEDVDPARIIDLKAPKRPNEFLPNRRVTPPANNSPERSRRRPNVNADVGRVQTFTNRMAGEMNTHRNMLVNNDTLPVDDKATRPTIPNPKGFDSFQVQQRSEREKELQALREGKTNDSATVNKRRDTLTPNSGTITTEAKVGNLPRVGPVKSPLPDHFPVTQGSIRETRPLMGDITAPISTRTGGDLGTLENKLNNPLSTVNHPREGILDRQQSIMKTAKNSDQHMRDLEATNLLPTHVPKNNRTDHGWLYNGDRVGGGTLNNNANKPYHAIGTNFFDEQRPINNGGVEKLLPQMPTWNSALANDGNRSNESRTNVWSESDVNPVKVTNSGRAFRNGYGPNKPWADLQNRDEERLLHTHPNSQVMKPNGQGGMSSGPVDHRFYVTNDHYKSAVPVSPLKKDYALNSPYASPYFDPLSSDSLEGQDKKELTRMTGGALETANTANLKHNNQQEKRDLAEIGLKQKSTETNYQESQSSALTANTEHNKQQEQRDLSEIANKQNLSDLAYQGSESSAKTANLKHNESQENRDLTEIGLKGKATSDNYDEALSSAMASSKRREELEEQRTQEDLKRLAPSDSIQSLYGMGKSGSQKWAANALEQQHLGVQGFLKPGDNDAPKNEPVPPMSDDVKNMYL